MEFDLKSIETTAATTTAATTTALTANIRLFQKTLKVRRKI
jgi:hypothetical protein